MTGTIKKPMEGKTFGFISPDNGEKALFFHESSLVGVALGDLEEGDKVTFEIKPGEEGGKGPSATNVTRA